VKSRFSDADCAQMPLRRARRRKRGARPDAGGGRGIARPYPATPVDCRRFTAAAS
jgi:hypothetical protein